jgi:transcriptional regulator
MNEIIELREKGLTYREIADKTGFSITSVRDVVMKKKPVLLGWKISQCDDKVVKLRKKGYSYSAVAREIGVHSRTVVRYIKKFHPELGGVVVSPDEKERLKKRKIRDVKVVNLKHKGLTHKQIGKKMGMSPSLVHMSLKREAPELLCYRGDRMRKRDKQIVEMREQGVSRKVIAETFNTSESNIGRILSSHQKN